jgi:hypothetical protein
MEKAFETYENFKKFSKSRVMIVDDEEFCITFMEQLAKKAGLDTQY